MTLPEPSFLSLSEAAQRVADRCGVARKAARAALDREFRSPFRQLVPLDPSGRTIENWDDAAIDWRRSSITWRGHAHLENVGVSTLSLDIWIGRTASRAMPKRQRMTPAQDWANRAFEALWPDGDIPPEPAVVISEIREWTAHKDQRGVAISGDTIRRVLRQRQKR